MILLRDLGAALSPFNAFLFLQGLETLHLRIQRHSENALRVAQFLADHPLVTWVSYPGPRRIIPRMRGRSATWRAGSAACLRSACAAEPTAAQRVASSTKLFSLLANVGDAKSLIIHPASTTHEQLSDDERAAAGVTADLVRLSVGIEDVDDLLRDLDQALS